jgi:hypothetical protein
MKLPRLVIPRSSPIGCLAVLTVSLTAISSTAVGQNSNAMSDLASRAAIVVLGTVTKSSASEEPTLAPTNATAVIKIDRMFAGSEFAGDQTGRSATVILSKPGSVKVGTQAMFFGNPRFIGKTLTIADIGELPTENFQVQSIEQNLAPGLQAYRDTPVRARLALAEMVFSGKVETVRTLEAAANDRKSELRDEHDPGWQVANVRVTKALRGAKDGALVPVIFAASRDIMWLNSPKPKPGDEALFLGHKPKEDDIAPLRAGGILSFVEKENAVLATAPLDVLPASEEKRIMQLLGTEEVR